MIKIYKNNKMISKKNQGYAILELLFYITFFATLSLVVINAMITMSRSFRETAIQAQLVRSGSIMERMSREIRQATDINSISANDLVLNTGANKTIEFKFISDEPDVQLWENSGSNIFTGNLNTPNIIVTAITFTQIITTKGKAVKILLTVKSTNDVSGRTQDFYDTIVLRGSY